MAENWRQIAAQEYAGFSIVGDGPFLIIPDENVARVQLYSFRMEAAATGKHVRELQPPAPRRAFRKIHYED